MEVVTCAQEIHLEAIRDILNEVIMTSTALYEYQPRSLETMSGWFRHKRDHGYPVIGMVDDSGALAGFATYGAFRPYPAYKYTVEHSVYVERSRRGQGVGKALMRKLMSLASDQQYHVMIGVVDAENDASIALHDQLGFARAGLIRHAGFKFGRWLDAALYQRLLPTPDEPEEG